MLLDIDRIYKKQPETLMTAVAVTTTSSKIDARGYNAALLKVTLSAAKNWTIKLQGAMHEQDTYVDLYELANTGSMAAMSYQFDASRMFLFKGIPDWIKVVATEDVDGATCTVEIQLLNV
jgi:hypothetical protein